MDESWIYCGNSPQVLAFIFGSEHKVYAAGFAELPQVPLVQLRNNLFDRRRYGSSAALSVALNTVGAFVRDHIAIPVGPFRVGGRLGFLNRNYFVRLWQFSIWSITRVNQ